MSVLQKWSEMSNDDLVNELVDLGYEVFNELLERHDDGVFLPSVLHKFPNWERQVNALHKNYYTLFLELGVIINLVKNSQLEEAVRLFVKWNEDYSKYHEDYNLLCQDSENLELGSDP